MMNNDRKFGWARDEERPDAINEMGLEPESVLMRMKAAYPNFDAMAEPWNVLFDQAQQGSCQGHALAHVAQIMCVQAFSSQRMFSRACGYYESQRHDGIIGDKGSTLSGGQAVLSGDGLVLEQAWPYPDRYNANRPANFQSLPRIRVKSSKVIKDADLIWALLDAGAAIQTGVNWNSSFDVPVSDQLSTQQGGGHSTMLYGKDKQTGHAVHHNSWRNWQNNQRNLWTLNFLKQILQKDRWAVFVAYESSDVQVDDGIVLDI